MKNHYLKKSLAVAIISIFMLVSLPKVVSDDDIEFPKENGPYQILVGGNWRGGTPKPLTISREHIQIGPICYMKYPSSFEVFLFESSFIKIEGEVQTIDDYAEITIYGFKGHRPAIPEYFVRKVFFNGFGLRISGQCDEIDITNYS